MKARAAVNEVEPGSLAEQAGIRPGDCLVTINGEPIRDLIDYRFLEADEDLELEVERAGRRLRFRIEKDYDTEMGCRFAMATFDGIRRCANRCLFCFVDQLPKGLRTSLYIKDDDYRLSFLHGNFVTLTNLKEADWKRIEEQGLSPLYISIHATDNDLRRKLLGNPKAPEIMSQLERLGGMGVIVHAQIVLSPGLNDGPVLDRTVHDLGGLENVESIGVVPVGLTAFCKPALARMMAADYALRRHTAGEAREVLNLIAPWQNEFRAARGQTLVHASDEFYLLAGKIPPRAAWYDGFPQLENGIGMVRRLLDDWSACKRRLKRSVQAGLWDRPDRGESLALQLPAGGDVPRPCDKQASGGGRPDDNQAPGGGACPCDSHYAIPEETRRGPCALPLSVGGDDPETASQDSPALPEVHETIQPKHLAGKEIAILTGVLAAPVLRRIAWELEIVTGVQARVIAVANRFFGPSVTVAGLLSGADLLAAACGLDPHAVVFIPRTSLDAAGEWFLDDMTLEEFRQATGREVHPAGFLSEVVEAPD